MNVLGIETSCDETAVAIVKDGKKVLSNVIASQDLVHQRFGGVVPELASRLHTEIIDSLFLKALRKSKIPISQINLIAVTSSPGLKGSLLIGNTFARSLAFAKHIPLIEVNHLQAHLAANFLDPPQPLPSREKKREKPLYPLPSREEGSIRRIEPRSVNGIKGEIKFPAIGLIVSGGHTNLFYLETKTRIKPLGETLDDAAGEVFDKVARVLNLEYPGGPALEKAAEKGGSSAIKFPSAYLGKKSLDFSFSGVKTSVIYYVKKYGLSNIPDIAAGFQKAVIEVLVEKLRRALRFKKVPTVLLGGGVISNKVLRQEMRKLALAEKINLFYPSPILCTDNAAMVASLGYYLYQKTSL